MKKSLSAIAACAAAVLLLAVCPGSRAQAAEEEGKVSETELTKETADAGAPVVYFTSDISAEGLVKIYDALGWTPSGKTAVKVSTGEPPASNYLRPELIGALKICMGWKRFALYILYVMAFSFVSGLLINRFL